MLKINSYLEENEKYKFEPKINNKNHRINNSIIIEFDNLKILGKNSNDDNIKFIVYSYLYLNDEFNDTLYNLLNNLIPNSLQPNAKSKVVVDSKDKTFTISFNNVLKGKKEHNFIIQIKISVNKNNDQFYNKYLVYSFNLTIPKEFSIEKKNLIIYVMIFIIVAILVLVFVIYYKMKKKNLNLELLLKTSFKENENKKEEEEEEDKSYNII